LAILGEGSKEVKHKIALIFAVGLVLLIGCTSSNSDEIVSQGEIDVGPEPTGAISPTTLLTPTTVPTPVPTAVTPVPQEVGTKPEEVVETPQPTVVPPTPVGQEFEWPLLFQDEFEGTAVDSSRWVKCYWWDNDGCTIVTNDELEWYQPDDVLVEEGRLRLRAQERTVTTPDGDVYNYTSGMVSTGRDVSDLSVPAKFIFQYGYVEIQAKVPAGQGLWPAFWLLPADHISKPEIDVAEILGHKTDILHLNFHYLDEAGTQQNAKFDFEGPDLSAGWHTFAVDWRPDAIIWYLDGVEIWRYEESQNIPTEPMYVILNLAVGGDWPGAPDSTTVFPAYFDIEYIRVWQNYDQFSVPLLADSFTSEDEPDANFGDLDNLTSDGLPHKTIFLHFDPRDLDLTQLNSASLQINVLPDDGSQSGSEQSVYLISTIDWDEKTITYKNRPVDLGILLGQFTANEPGVRVTVPLDISLLEEYLSEDFTIAVVTEGEDGLHLYSREDDLHRPQLILTGETAVTP
jgi:beta-glucanase (GH16 family)